MQIGRTAQRVLRTFSLFLEVHVITTRCVFSGDLYLFGYLVFNVSEIKVHSKIQNRDCDN
jgi:hypothetical protein